MPGRPLDAEAAFNSLSPAVHRDLILIRRYIAARDRALGPLLGETVQQNPLREEIARAVLIQFGYGRVSAVGHYVHHCERLASSFAVRSEIRALVDLHLLVTRKLETDGRVTLVAPTTRLVRGVSRAVPRISRSLEHFFISKAEMRE